MWIYIVELFKNMIMAGLFILSDPDCTTLLQMLTWECEDFVRCNFEIKSLSGRVNLSIWNSGISNHSVFVNVTQMDIMDKKQASYKVLIKVCVIQYYWGYKDKSPQWTTPNRLTSAQLMPTKPTPHEDQYQPRKLLTRTNTVRNCPGGELSEYDFLDGAADKEFSADQVYTFQITYSLYSWDVGIIFQDVM